MEDCPKGFNLGVKCPYAAVEQVIGGERSYPKRGICFGNADQCVEWQRHLLDPNTRKTLEILNEVRPEEKTQQPNKTEKKSQGRNIEIEDENESKT